MTALRKPRDYILIYLKGVAMGGADVIPGVSGGTIAFIAGIYDELVQSLHAIDIRAARLLTRFEFRNCWHRINGSFLLTVLLGILTSLLSLSRLMSYLLIHYPIQVWSFFFGLILISAPVVLRNHKIRTPANAAAFVLGVLAAYLITALSPAQTPNGHLFVFLSGAIAICAMILPGISGAFILLLLGKYEYMINALTDWQVLILFVFALGCITGLLSFVRLLKWLLDRYKDAAVALLAGFMLGSLNKVWPWKKITMYTIDQAGNQVPALDRNVLPWEYFAQTGKEPLILQALLMVALGIILVVALERAALIPKN